MRRPERAVALRDKIYTRASIGNISMVYNQLRAARRGGGCEGATAAISGYDARRRFRLERYAFASLARV